MRPVLRPDPSIRKVFRLLSAIALAIGAGFLGCSDQPIGNGNVNENGGAVNAPPVVTIKLTLDQNIPADQPFTILYDVSNSPSSVIAFYDTDGVTESGDEFVFPNVSDLTGGANQAVLFDTAAVDENGQRIIGLGTYHIGIRASNNFGTTIQYAKKEDSTLVSVRVNGIPEPSIDSPTIDIMVLSGVLSSVDVVFSCNDAEAALNSSEVSWMLFYDTNQVADDGTSGTIGTGTGNASAGSFAHTVTWSTLGVPEDTYYLGLTCTDSAASIQTSYGSGQVVITAELPIPTIEITEPASDLVVIGTEEDITIEFASSDPADSEAAITLFIDTNDSLGFDETEIELASALSASSTSFSISSSIIPNGEYFIGAYIEKEGQFNADYASGKLIVSGTGDLTVSQPSEPLTITPGTDVTVRWNTNVPNGQGLIDLTLYNALSDGTRLGIMSDPDPFEDAKSLEIIPSSTTLQTTFLPSGFYVIEVMLTPVDENDVPIGDPVSSAYSATIRVTTLPNIFWVGSIELEEDQQNNPPLGHFDGLIFEGVNFEDNAGTSLLGLSEIEQQPLVGGFLIAARFAKPLFTNPNGIGAGEAYLIYNDFSQQNRRYSLNAVGAKISDNDDDADPDALSGLRFSGVVFDQTPEDINQDGQINIYSEDVDGPDPVSGLQKLDLFFEDINEDGIVDTIEDLDLDGFGDVAEDGVLGIDNNGDGVVDIADEFFFVQQYINGALDVNVTEDRDGDGALDEIGDATWGLSTMALLPDVDLDGLPEIAFGFEFTDSLEADFRSTILGETEPVGFGTLSQENHFERGGLVMIPSSDEPTILNPFQQGRDENRVIQLDFVGQGFAESPEDAADDDDEQDTTGLIGNIPEGRPLNGQDAFPFVENRLGDSTIPSCGANTVQLEFINNLSVDYLAEAKFIIRRVPAGGGETNDDDLTITATPHSFIRDCSISLDADESVTIIPTGVSIWNPDLESGPQPVADADIELMSNAGPFTSGTPLVIYGAVGSWDDNFFGIDVEENPLGIGMYTCSTSGSDNCFESIVGPFFGFYHAGLWGGFLDDDLSAVESPTHPLAYRRTLSNPEIREEEFSFLNLGCDKCGRVLSDVNSIRVSGGAPPFEIVASGFYPGVAIPPIGARLLGQRVGDRFGVTISRSPGDDDRVFVGAPRRPIDEQVDIGAVYQFKMERFWLSSNDLAGLNDFDATKPHQYIIRDVGSSRPDGLYGNKRTAINDAIFYTGADPGDRLGQSVLGIEDFNGDARADLMMGAPGAAGKNDDSPDAGAVYCIYRLPPDIEASVSLDKIELEPSNPNRLNGLLINGDADDQLGTVLDGNCDLNGDDQNDLVLGNPLHGEDDNGEVVVVFGGPNLASPENGYTIQELVDLGRAVRIQGISNGDQAGFNVVCNGDFDGDGQDDLVITAPNATPQYDSNGDDALDTPGLDLNKDGVDDGLLTNPTEAGLMYVILNTPDLSGTISLSQMGGVLQGFIFAGLKGGDQLGGGIETKRNTRSQGLAYAGDVDADGKDDILVSAIFADPNGKTNAGEIYLIYGLNEQEASKILSEEE